MRVVRYHPEAREEFLRQVAWYAGFSTRLAERYDRAVRKAEVQAAEAPEQWPPYSFRTRRIIDRTFKFSLVYFHNENEIYVVALAPMQRKPAYWKARLSDG
ncbi:MAG: type II toxin-antitoxin system RelE/ParE family toxin [Lautropia sp.]|nr:MAG: type II toxin-antitoxin system RelE/ParE family toxin [Planctomycetota bacterium]MBC6960658.1 type II toxin-antitoxin system RelE/ParE family toxin [Lautropia sp.]MCL4702585.1 type II toxin-antitoxin system RelE/ParE family toxin [Burkholderiaceae bacterium]MCZ2415192.1 type II toxin-antitoxin system RelE/ParE family toxin [Burkholderiales bacterium]MDL1907948.1 type II toxin-antitoxin system RelE/ParE family toxin [Betaproteobacteria bacterium PRO1]